MTSDRMIRADGFPVDFLWGASSASYQIEGSVHADGRSASIWDTFAHSPGAVLGGMNGDLACDSYRRWREDIGLLRGLGVDAYRFSLAWPRIQPEGRGQPNRLGIDHYRRCIEGLLEAGIEPWVCLYHWDLPQVLEDAGGWPSRDTAFRFGEYAELCFRELGDLASIWLTVNEPWCSAFLGYRNGHHAPGRKDTQAAFSAAHHLMLGHGLALEAFRASPPHGSTGKSAKIGIAINAATPRPATRRPEDAAAADRAGDERTRIFFNPLYGRDYPARLLAAHKVVMPIRDGDMEKIARGTDFVGINYYNESIVEAVPVSAACPEGFREIAGWEDRTEMDWPIMPSGLSRLLCAIHEEWAPQELYVTENGAAFKDEPDAAGQVHDRDRIAYLHEHIGACLVALQAGVALKGYLVWSLLDNFEWAFGYSRRFGLVHVDFGTQERRPKDSYYWYRDLVAGHIPLSGPARR